MVVSEEIEALQAEAIDPVRFLVVPRMIATIVMMICLAVVGDLLGVLGGMVVSHLAVGISFHQYVYHTFAILELKDFLTGLLKAGVFGAIISALACFLGLGVTGGAQGVGAATTSAVVTASILILALDYILTQVLFVK